MLFVLNGIHIINPNNHGFIIAPSVPVDLVPFFTVERIFIHIRQPPFSHSHTLCIRLRSTEPESKTSLFIQIFTFLFQKIAYPRLSFPSFPIVPGSSFAFILIPHSIARASHIVFCLIFFPIASLSFPSPNIPITTSSLRISYQVVCFHTSSIFFSCCAPASAAPLHISNS